jgi:predicted ribosomally synthesized peptide with SipW-like signal peptide
MKKSILMSLALVVVIGAAAASATGAFFSDTETSTGNTFTAGAIDLTVDSEQHYNGNECVAATTTAGFVWNGPSAYPVAGTPCDGTWLATNLGAQKFFNFLDVKPGDFGENTISLHVDSNDAYACVDVAITKNDDVTCNDPENDAEGLGICNTDGLPDFDGELAQNLKFFAWADTGATPGFQGLQDTGEGDNIYQANEIPLFSNGSGPASDVLDGESYTLANSITGPLVGNSTSYIGLAWCAGTFADTTLPGIDLTCSGVSMGNDAQTDTMVANIAFRVEQARNNPNFTCTPPIPVIPIN